VGVKMKPSNQYKLNPIFLFLFGSFFVIMFWLYMPILQDSLIYLITTSSKSTDFAFKGQFGDSYGTLNTLFSGLAFVAIAVTLYLQNEEFTLQRE